MKLLKIQDAISMLSTTLHEEQATLPNLKIELTQRLHDLALQGLTCEDPSLDEIRAAIEHAERSIREIPPVIGLLEMQETALLEQEKTDSQLAGKRENDRKFFELLEQIIAAGAASTAELATLCRYSGGSTNPARRFEMDRLTEALEDHARLVSTAKNWNREAPTFSFKLEEQTSPCSS